ncbi:2-succinyl-5-enolpyruvyl-6-hydroxy-3-cyclohexene-1-carboxylate synthase, partial [Dissostichus eleginoides]
PRQRSHGPGGHAGVTVCPKRSPRQHGVQIGEALLRGGQRRVVCTGNVVDTNVPLSSQFYNGNATGQLNPNVKAPKNTLGCPRCQYCVLEEN